MKYFTVKVEIEDANQGKLVVTFREIESTTETDPDVIRNQAALVQMTEFRVAEIMNGLIGVTFDADVRNQLREKIAKLLQEEILGKMQKAGHDGESTQGGEEGSA